ncbi:hypothetical protein HOC37_07400 [bacterium]|jgi:hypothetical protein|nr:hypothetical protein [bacterium]MBT4552782.1 hypothetical protein [bacterium]MBT5989206.1 hypothetical protein [bacterium]MBT7087380.1 hypothetical protein [bacterium]
MRKLYLILLSLFLISTLVLGSELLTKTDLTNLQKRKISEHILYELYFCTDQGIASVFGYHFDSYFTENHYFTLAIFGAVAGERGGYGIAAFGLGANYPITDKLYWDAKALLGSGGGGGLPAGGGFAVEVQAGLSYEFMKNVFFDLKAGYLKFPTGTLETPILNFGLSFREKELYLPY